MHPEVAQVVAEMQLRRQHRFLQNWCRADQRDENMWTRHDDEGHAMPYGICTVCEYLRNKEAVS